MIEEWAISNVGLLEGHHIVYFVAGAMYGFSLNVEVLSISHYILCLGLGVLYVIPSACVG